MGTEEEFRAELAELGEEKFRLKYGRALTAAVIAELDRTKPAKSQRNESSGGSLQPS